MYVDSSVQAKQQNYENMKQFLTEFSLTYEFDYKLLTIE